MNKIRSLDYIIGDGNLPDVETHLHFVVMAFDQNVFWHSGTNLDFNITLLKKYENINAF